MASVVATVGWDCWTSHRDHDGESSPEDVLTDTLRACARARTSVGRWPESDRDKHPRPGSNMEEPMNGPKQSNWRRMLSVSTAGAAAATLIVACGSDSSSYEVVARDGDVSGISVAEASEVFAKWVIETPLEQSWLADPALCDAGASTPEMYYAPTWASDGDATTSCTMSADQALVPHARCDLLRRRSRRRRRRARASTTGTSRRRRCRSTVSRSPT